MYNLLKGKKGIITGALDDASIAWKVAEKAVENGAEIILSNAPIALRMGKIKELSDRLNAPLVPADVTVQEDVDNLFDTAKEKFGKIDFFLHSIGMSLNVRKNRPYTDLNYEFLHKTYDVSAISFHRMMQSAWKKDAINPWGSIIALTYIAAQRAFPKYNDMTESKAILESMARTFGYYWGKERKVRVNTVSQSPTPTTAGSGVAGFDAMLHYGDKMSPLGNASADECADFIIVLFSDLTKKITMQNIMHDGGFSSMGVSEDILDAFNS